MSKKEKFKLSNINTDFSQWYQDVIHSAELAEQSPVKGCITILPYGFSLWERMQEILNKEIKKMGAQNMAFPLLIPYSFFEKEKDHIDGFAPEVAIVTHAGGKKLEEPLVIRPTSEVIIHDYFKNKIKSWRDLPLKVNQWCSVIRWEKRPRAFLRTTEFWWQEGHTAHSNYLEALAQSEEAINLYEVFAKNILAIPVLKARKPDYERFAGAEITWTIEGMMQDGKAVQMGTSHVLGQGFANALQMEFQDKDMQNKVPFLTSWGVTTRLIGTLIMVHGDQYGLVLPPLVAPILFIIVPIFKNDNDEKNKVLDIVEKFKSFFNCYSISFSVDERDEVSPGVKFFESEIKGIPFRIEIGVRDIEKEIFTLFERDLRLKKECLLSLLQTYELFYSFILKLQKDMQERIFKKAENFYNKRLFLKTKLSEFGPFLIKDNGFFITHWCCKDEDVFKEYQASVRCILETNVLNCECCLHDNCEEILNKILVAKSY